MSFLINHFEVFLIIYLVIGFDTILGVLEAVINHKFNWAFFPDFIYTMLRYSVFLLFGNALEYFSQLSGYKIDGLGFFPIAFALFAVEAASIYDSIKKLPNKNNSHFNNQKPNE